MYPVRIMCSLGCRHKKKSEANTAVFPGPQEADLVPCYVNNQLVFVPSWRGVIIFILVAPQQHALHVPRGTHFS
jgi:hypothetical protein